VAEPLGCKSDVLTNMPPKVRMTTIVMISERIIDKRHSYNGILIGTYTSPTQGCHFE